MEINKKFVKFGNNVAFKQEYEGSEYSLEDGKCYTVAIDRYSDEINLTVMPDLNLPEKVYETSEDTKFIDKVLKYFNKETTSTAGVMLSGLKGSGKTIMAKEIAVKSNLPIILIDKSFRPSCLIKLFNKLKDIPVCVMFDEIDKLGEDYDDDYLLKILDGVNTCGKKLVLCTCNNSSDVNQYLKDRCSRIRYWKEFKEISPSMMRELMEDKLDDKTEIKPLIDFITKNFGCMSFDNICSFVEEVNDNQSATYEELLSDMNLSTKQ